VRGRPAGTARSPTAEGAVLEAWRARRLREVATARLLDGCDGAGLRRHVYGLLATPHPFVAPLGRSAGAVQAVEDWLAQAASALHLGLIAERTGWYDGSNGCSSTALVAKACEGLRRIERDLQHAWSDREAVEHTHSRARAAGVPAAARPTCA